MEKHAIEECTMEKHAKGNTETGAEAMPAHCPEETGLLLVRYGEIGLKGKNIRTFEKRLSKNIKHALEHFSDIKVIDRHGRIYVEYDMRFQSEVIQAVKVVFGIVSVSPATRVALDLSEIKTAAVALVSEQRRKGKGNRFKVESRRANKTFPLTSPEISKVVGGYVHDAVDGIQVDVHTPEIVLNIEIREKAYLFCERIQGLGGMPYGSAGRGMLLLSGGIDSPVAAYLMARRGLYLEAVHFHSYPFTSVRAQDKVLELAKRLSAYTRYLRVHSINILEIQKAIRAACPSEEMTILSRVFMMKLAERIALERECKALVTGENLGQVASQTLESMTVTGSMVALPVFRPLLAYDKTEIMAEAERIDTFETSILPYEDCCTVFLPERVVTKPRIERIAHSLSLLDVEALIEAALETREVHVVKPI